MPETKNNSGVEKNETLQFQEPLDQKIFGMHRSGLVMSTLSYLTML